ncbi:hypothetical protein M2405_006200 [Rhodococcus erythropolis]|uniref:hypothetical protein n=1 Tax=Rhodococcus erythropolis TaxID=1833 RepID=UPI002167831B|nr:hypothetical protein [Rhodococcus erythropolis]MCS4257873.1 hypothetical protein [Rhodococcus erythropolis]MCW2425178.1 hypothetical protein [Rhodococcus erythropolis]
MNSPASEWVSLSERVFGISPTPSWRVAGGQRYSFEIGTGHAVADRDAVHRLGLMLSRAAQLGCDARSAQTASAIRSTRIPTWPTAWSNLAESVDLD